MSPYYTTLSCAQTHYLVHTDPMLCGPLTDSGCTYTSYFTSTVTLEVKVEQSLEMGVEWSSDLKSRVKQSSDLKSGAEQSSNSKSGAEQSSDLGVGWNLEQRKCGMGHPLTETVQYSKNRRLKTETGM